MQLAQGGRGLAPTQHWGWEGPRHPRGDSQAACLLSLREKGNAQEVGREGHLSQFLDWLKCAITWCLGT